MPGFHVPVSKLLQMLKAVVAKSESNPPLTRFCCTLNDASSLIVVYTYLTGHEIN